MKTSSHLTKFLWTLIAATLVTGCGEELPALMKASEVKTVAHDNLVRSSIGLRMVEENWVLYRSNKDVDDWKSSPTDGHLAKRVFKTDHGGIRKEEDYYYSGKQFTDREGIWAEFVTVNYDYSLKSLRALYVGTNQSIAEAISPFGTHSDRVKEGLAAVASVVKSW